MSFTDLMTAWAGEPEPAPDGWASATWDAVIDAGWAVWRRARLAGISLETLDDLAGALDACELIGAGARLRAATEALGCIAGVIAQAPALAEERP